jgi:hypothetical protein
MYPGLTPRQINEEFTSEQFREIRKAWDSYHEKMERVGAQEEQTDLATMAGLIG